MASERLTDGLERNAVSADHTATVSGIPAKLKVGTSANKHLENASKRSKVRGQMLDAKGVLQRFELIGAQRKELDRARSRQQEGIVGKAACMLVR